MRIAGELDVGPWEALGLAVRLAAHRVAWIEQQVEKALQDAAGRADDPKVLRWLAESRRERTLMTRTAKSAVDAGVAERLVRQVEMEGRLVADAVGRALDALDLDQERRALAFSVAHRALLEPTAGQDLDDRGAGG